MCDFRGKSWHRGLWKWYKLTVTQLVIKIYSTANRVSRTALISVFIFFLNVRQTWNLFIYSVMNRSGCEFYIINVNFRFSSIINFSWEMNLLPSSIYMHLKTNSIKHMQSLILGECGSHLFLCSVKYFSFCGCKIRNRIGQLDTDCWLHNSQPDWTIRYRLLVT
jgi:hypothetical protein